jgi:hypothetical protein
MTTVQTLVFLVLVGLGWLALTALDWRRLLARPLPPPCRMCGFTDSALPLDGGWCAPCRARAVYLRTPPNFSR